MAIYVDIDYVPNGPTPKPHRFNGIRCTSVGLNGGVLENTGNILDGIENTCELANPVNVPGMDAILYDATCRGKRMIDEHRTMILRNDHGVYVISNGYASDWMLCEK